MRSREATTPLRTGDLLYRARLGVPWVTLLLVVTCFLVSTPLFVDPRRFYLTLGVDFCNERGVLHWWHAIVAPFVHGTGCPFPAFPPLGLHVAINVALFVLHGMLVERVLGSGRAAAVTFASLAVHIPLVQILVAGRGHGASGITWSYLLFAIDWLAWIFQRRRWRILAEPLTDAVLLMALFATAGLVKHWHLWNVLVSIPFYLAWRRTFRENLAAIEHGETPDRGNRTGSAVGIAIAVAILAFCAYFVVAAVSGWIRPASLGPIP